MPYELYRSGDKYCVRNKDTGESKGCSVTREKATAHMRALYAVEGGATMGKKKDVDLDELYTEFDATLEPIVDDGPNDVPVFEKVKSWVTDLVEAHFVAKAPLPVVTLIKEKSVDASGAEVDRLRFVMPYTNNRQDRHDEIFTLESHKQFESWVDDTKVYPEAWLWHVPGSRWGQTDFISIDSSGFGTCSGLVDVGCEHIAESLAKSKDIGVSHSCWATQEGPYIKRYYTYEISPTPANRAANIWHEGVKLLEDDMALDPTKRAWLVQHAGEDFVSKMEKDFESRASVLDAQGVKSKDDGAAAPVAQVQTPTGNSTVAQTDPQSGDPPVHTDPPTNGAASQVTLEDLTTALQAVVQPIAERLDGLEAKQKSIDDRAEEIFGQKIPEGYVASQKNKSEAPPNEGVDFEWLEKSKRAFALSEGN